MAGGSGIQTLRPLRRLRPARKHVRAPGGAQEFQPELFAIFFTHRRDVVYPATIAGVPPMEDFYIGATALTWPVAIRVFEERIKCRQCGQFMPCPTTPEPPYTYPSSNPVIPAGRIRH